MLRLLILLFSASLLMSCGQRHELVTEQRLFGYGAEIIIYSSDRALARRALDAVVNDLKLLDSYTDVAKSKPLARVNGLLQSREWFSVNPSLYELIQQSSIYYRKTGGIFNPAALGALRQAWGFYGKKPDPNLEKINALLKQDLTMDDIEIRGIRVRGEKTLLQLDFDLLGIGYAIDNQLQHLSELGIARAVLHIGPITGTLGKEPQIVKTNHHLRIELKPGESLCHFTAGDSRFPQQGRIDPRNAWPVKPIPTVTVIHGSASTASVACAVLTLAGEDKWQSLVSGLGLDYASWSRGGQEHITAAMRVRREASEDINMGKDKKI